MDNLKIGDIVRIKLKRSKQRINIAKREMLGQTAKIVDMSYFNDNDNRVGLEFNFHCGHDCNGNCRGGHGWYVYSYEIEKPKEIITGILSIGDV